MPHNIIEERQEALDWLFNEIFAEEMKHSEESREARKPSGLSDEELLRIAFAAKNGDAFKALWNGDISGHSYDDSAADYDLLKQLAFWTGGDACQMERLFSSSALGQREKWRGREDYRERSIQRAIRDQNKFYHPKQDRGLRAEDVCDIELDEDTGDVKSFELAPTKAAKALLEHLRLAMEHNSDDIYYFEDDIYKPNGARKIDMLLCKLAGDAVNIRNLKEVLRRVSNQLLDKPIEFDADPYLLCVKNGVIDLRTGEIRPYSPNDYITDKIDVLYDPEAKCPEFMAFLESITPDITDRLMLIDWLAATAIREPFPYVLFLLGLGRNGKGVYERLLKKFFGLHAFRDMPLTSIEKSDFAASEFYKKRGWIASETGKRKNTIGTDFLKLTSGNGVIDANVKGKKRIQYEPYFQTVVDTNTMPEIDDSSIGWQERFCKANLPYVFVAEPDANNPLEKKRDPHLIDKLTTAGELSGILNLVIFRAKKIAKTKAITRRPSAEMFREYADQSVSVSTFLELFCDCAENMEFWAPAGNIYDSYREWCGYKVGEVVDPRYFGKLLKEFFGGMATKVGKDTDRKSIRLYKGLNFDSSKFREHINAMKKNVSTSPLQESTTNLQEDMSTDSDVYMSTTNKWIQTYRTFGNPNYPIYGGISKKDVEHVDNVDNDSLRPPDVSTTGGGDVDQDVDKDDPGFQKFKAGIKKRTCCLCGRKFPYPLTPYFNKGQSGFICATCHMEGPPSEPEKANPQTKLEAGA